MCVLVAHSSGLPFSFLVYGWTCPRVGSSACVSGSKLKHTTTTTITAAAVLYVLCTHMTWTSCESLCVGGWAFVWVYCGFTLCVCVYAFVDAAMNAENTHVVRCFCLRNSSRTNGRTDGTLNTRTAVAANLSKGINWLLSFDTSQSVAQACARVLSFMLPGAVIGVYTH